MKLILPKNQWTKQANEKEEKFFIENGTFKFVASLLIWHFSTVKFVQMTFKLLKIEQAYLVG